MSIYQYTMNYLTEDALISISLGMYESGSVLLLGPSANGAQPKANHKNLPCGKQFAHLFHYARARTNTLKFIVECIQPIFNQINNIRHSTDTDKSHTRKQNKHMNHQNFDENWTNWTQLDSMQIKLYSFLIQMPIVVRKMPKSIFNDKKYCLWVCVCVIVSVSIHLSVCSSFRRQFLWWHSSEMWFSWCADGNPLQ